LPAPAVAALGVVPQLGTLLAGVPPLDLPALGQSADRFFAQLADLVEEPAAARIPLDVTAWLLTATAMTGAFECARRLLKKPLPDIRTWDLLGLHTGGGRPTGPGPLPEEAS
jgi:hypothetical protein